MSAFFYVLCLVPVGLSVYLDLLPLHVMLVWITFSVIGNGIIYSMLRFNINKRFHDPSLTIPQMLLSIGLVLYLQIYAGQARGGYLLALMLAFAFGCFKLKKAQLLWLTFITVAIYVCTIPIIMRIEGPRFNPAVELALWTAFSIFMPSLAILAGSFNCLRKQLMEANQKLTDPNNFDGLTGVKNRSCFNQQFDHEWRRSQRTGDAVSLLMIDIDNFKTINDTYGHLGGDACLKRVATIIKDAARRLTDGAFRYGGEEFAVLLAATDVASANSIANTIRKLVEEANIVFDGKRIPVTVSIGVATMTSDETNPQANDILIVHADNALYQAKKRGRNRVCTFTPVWDERS